MTMLRSVPDHVWAFDLEWVPDLASGRRAYDLPATLPDDEVYAAMWAGAKSGAGAGATEEEPRPYLKTMLCRVVSMAVVMRKVQNGVVSLTLFSLPMGEAPMPERDLIGRFLTGIGEANPRPQLVGFNSRESDLPILIQRGMAQGISAPGFCRRPAKRWEGLEYFDKYNEGHIDLKEIVGGWGKATPSLHEFATACGIPGKMGTSGDSVIDLWLEGNVREIVEYNEFDALTTYLLWLRAAHFAGHFSAAAHAEEEERVRELIRKRVAGGQAHLGRYLERWGELARG